MTWQECSGEICRSEEPIYGGPSVAIRASEASNVITRWENSTIPVVVISLASNRMLQFKIVNWKWLNTIYISYLIFLFRVKEIRTLL